MKRSIKAPLCIGARAGVFTLVATAVLLSGCTQLAGIVVARRLPPTTTTTTTTMPTPSAVETTAVEDTALPNPYLSRKVNVPRAAQTVFNQALIAIQNKNLKKAEVLLQELTVQYPSLSGPWLNLGIVYRDTQRLSQAGRAFRKAISANAYNLDAYNQLAVLKREQGDFSGAETLYLKALEIWPQHSDTHRNLGILYDLYLGQLDKALLHFETCQNLLDKPDQQIEGWIIDLKRRLQNVAKRG